MELGITTEDMPAASAPPPPPTREDVNQRWDLIEADLFEVYGVDLHDQAVRWGRSMHWLFTLIDGLFERPPTLVPVQTDRAVHLLTVPSTRVGWLLNPPTLPTD